MPYNILMIASTSFFSDYGNHVRILEEIRALQRRGHRIVLVTYHNGDDIPGITIYRSWDVPWIKRAVVGSSRHKLYLDIGLGWRVLRTALQMHPDVIHAHTHEAAAIGLPLQRLLRRPLILDYQGSMTSEMLDHGFIRRSNPLFVPLTRLERMLNRTADAVMTSTHNAANLLRRDGSVAEDRLFTIADGVDTERFRPFDGSPEWTAQRAELRAQLGIPSDRRIVVYIGLLAPYQGTNLLLEVARHLCQRYPDLHFLIMGHPDPQSYRNLAASLGIADHVTLPGRIMYRDLHSYLALGEVAVAPKMSLTEGNGKIGNYMAMGLPTVAFDTPVNREILGPYGFYAKLGSVADFAAQLELALTNRELAAERAAGARARAVAELSWERAAIAIEAIYAAVIARRQQSDEEANE
ncbi:glycosyltransferase family 4 protein [Chloroflexus sp. MS-CIW-1]|jgi:glycosyltransferase involved in cell wall biosynthesis|uniref:glycosyltransferase family 4 protein n=1 Tax=unclassified Chloroflexus TaxID=2633855 RepID=UPI0004DEDD73|nr:MULTISPECIES: glycosyltransferase family 4 protein [unclassified Chloroflexus]MDN5271687.1 glycosyltransferase family 4 protein [Chloroflexus sp. MS-CIW-1]